MSPRKEPSQLYLLELLFPFIQHEFSTTNCVDSDLALSFSAIPTCQISDALIKLKFPHGGHIPDILPVSLPSPDARVCGPAYTVRVVTELDNHSPMFSTPIHWMDSVPSGSIVVIRSDYFRQSSWLFSELSFRD